MRMQWEKKWGMAVLTMVLGMGLLVGCGGGQNAPAEKKAELTGNVTAAGSTALLPLLKPAQEEFQKKHKKVNVNVTGGGSFTGLTQVAAGNVNIGNADVDLPPEYKDKGLVDHKVAVMPFVFIVNKDVEISSLSKQQYIDIFTGKITNWNQVGGKDEKITLIHRAKSSGSRATIARVVLQDEAFTDNAVIQDSNGAVRAAIANTPGAIGYVDAPYADASVKVLAYDGVTYSPQAVMEGKYPVYAYGHMYTKGEPTESVKAFLDYVMSKEFQDTYLEANHYIPITKMKK